MAEIMRILQWAFPYFPSIGGRERLIQNLTSGLQGEGNQVTLVAQQPSIESASPDDERLGVRSRYRPVLEIIPKFEAQKLQQRFELKKLLEEHRIEIIHLHNLEGLDFMMIEDLMSWWHGAFVFTLHAHLDSGSEIIRKRLEKLDLVIAVSQYIYSETARDFPELEGRLHLIGNGVPETNKIPALGDEFLFSGRLAAQKGVAQLLAAFSIFTSTVGKRRLHIAGDGPDRELLIELVQKFGLKELVDFHGWLDPGEIALLQAKSRATLVPSVWQEPFGLVAAESMMAGIPVIFANSGALPSMVGHNIGGLGFDSGDITGLSSCLIKLDRDVDFAQKLGDTGRKNALRLYSSKTMISAYQKLLSGLLEDRK
jgi:glycosyltransferase involved in cell wall biosynthesis